MRDVKDVLRELYMLTGVVDKDKEYLYYLLVKDGTMFQKQEEPEVIETKDSVDSFDEWFNNL